LYNHANLKAKINYLCELKGITQKKLLSDLGFGINLLRNATNERGMSGAVLYSIADYLDVSIDYLVGRTENQQSHKS